MERGIESAFGKIIIERFHCSNCAHLHLKVTPPPHQFVFHAVSFGIL